MSEATSEHVAKIYALAGADVSDPPDIPILAEAVLGHAAIILDDGPTAPPEGSAIVEYDGRRWRLRLADRQAPQSVYLAIARGLADWYCQLRQLDRRDLLEGLALALLMPEEALATIETPDVASVSRRFLVDERSARQRIHDVFTPTTSRRFAIGRSA